MSYRSPQEVAKYRRRRTFTALLAIFLLAFGYLGVNKLWSAVQERITASDKVVPSNPITPTPSVKHTTQQVPACSDEETIVSVVLDANTNEFDLTSNVLIHATITNASTQKCLRDIGSKSNEIAVFDANNKQVWSSDTCPVKQEINLVELQPGDIARITLTWGGNSDPTKCGKTAKHVPAGDYTIVASNGNAKSEPLPIIFSTTTPTR
ncbi:MAG: hypothetical protein RIS43_410 [Actinomycetota bacterium]